MEYNHRSFGGGCRNRRHANGKSRTAGKLSDLYGGAGDGEGEEVRIVFFLVGIWVFKIVKGVGAATSREPFGEDLPWCKKRG